MTRKDFKPTYEQYSLFDYALDDKGKLTASKIKREEKKSDEWQPYSLESILNGETMDNDLHLCANQHTGWSAYGRTLEDVRKEARRQAKTKTFHFANMEKGIYVYSFNMDYDERDGETYYMMAFENERHIAVCGYWLKSIDGILNGDTQICWAACCIEIYEKTDKGLMEIKEGYSDKREEDIRYKVLCGEFKILDFSTNRIETSKKPKDFCECQHRLSDFVDYWKGGEWR